MRADIVRTYKDIHSWVGIISGLALFIAFYAGAITMFETPLQRWASAPSTLPAAVALDDAPRLAEAMIAAHPEAARRYIVHVETNPETPARVSWSTGGRGEEGPQVLYGASFADDGTLVSERLDVSPVAQLVDILHQQIGLTIDHEIAMPIMGAICLLYAIAIVSGIIALLPSMVKDLFALRFGKNLKRMWLDVHNALGLFSVPFHLVMALTALIFAFHDQIYDIQDAIVYEHRLDDQWAAARPPLPQPGEGAQMLAPSQLLARLSEQAPGFTPTAIEYRAAPNGAMLTQIAGYDPRYGMRAPTYGFATVDPYSGQVLQDDYLPGHQTGWVAVVTQFFTLHFGSYGGDPIRWAYFFLGLGGAFIFYTGNLLWIEARRRRITRDNPETPQKLSTRILGSLTIGVALGCVAGISTTIAAAKWLPGHVDDLNAAHTWIYYAVFLAAIGWAFLRGPARGSVELLWACAATTALIPLSTLLGAAGATDAWVWRDASILVDVVAIAGVACFALFARVTAHRIAHGPRDSIWSAHAMRETPPQPDAQNVSA